MTDLIAVIDPKTGAVRRWIDLENILQPSHLVPGNHRPDVLNGIAYHTASKRIFVTGKHWPKMFEIEMEREPKLPSVERTKAFFLNGDRLTAFLKSMGIE